LWSSAEEKIMGNGTGTCLDPRLVRNRGKLELLRCLCTDNYKGLLDKSKTIAGKLKYLKLKLSFTVNNFELYHEIINRSDNIELVIKNKKVLLILMF
jgi:hypothetical protein